ncbi:MAG: hypothetical protein R3C20_17815 [Planctomycetaceae bacterium]
MKKKASRLRTRLDFFAGSADEEQVGRLTVGYGAARRAVPRSARNNTFGLYASKLLDEPILITGPRGEVAALIRLSSNCAGPYQWS